MPAPARSAPPAPARPAPAEATLGRPATLVVAALALVAISAYLVVAVGRLGYPFELEWIEGGSVEVVRHLLDGESIYAQPSIEFVPLPYPPLYFAFGAVASLVGGASFGSLRLVSLLASIGCGALIFAIVRQEVGGWLSGLAAAGLFAAAFGVTGAWYDLARVDSLFLALLLASGAAARRAQITASRRAAAAAGVLMALSFLTKQNALVVGLPVLGWLLLRERRLGIAFGIGGFVPTAVVTIAADLAAGGWYRYFVFEALGHHPVEDRFFAQFLTRDLIPHAWIVAAGFVVAALFSRRRPPALLAVFGGGLLVASWLGRLHSGGFDNNLMPAFAAVAIAFGLAMGWVGGAAGARRWWVVVVAVAIGQFALLAWNPADELPTAADRAAGRAFVAAVAAVPGDVMVVTHPTYAVAAGKTPYAHGAATGDILRGDDEELKALVVAEMAEAVKAGKWAVIVFDDTDTYRLGVGPQLADRYLEVPDPVFSDPEALLQVTALRTRPDRWYVRRPGP